MNRTIKFSENLKYYRTKHGLTQKQLAEHIGYTEKSVSKWEIGDALPTMDTFLKIAEFFKIPLDELMFEKTSCNYFLGIDGGGTKTAFKLIDENGLVLNKIYKSSSNPNDIGMENTIAVLKEGISEVCNGIPYSKVTMFAGLSGGGLTSENAVLLNRFFKKFGFYTFDNGSDVENLVSFADYEKCVLVIMGTGFIVYALNGEERKRISGWGQFFDDGGSGYTLGRDAITAVLCEADGSGEQTKLTSLLEGRIGETVPMHLAKFYQGGKRYIAGFADLVFLAAESGDKVSADILEKNMVFVADKINAALEDLANHSDCENIPILFSGRISEKADMLFPLIKKHIFASNCCLTRLEREPVDGAVKRAKSIFALKSKGENFNA